MFFKGVATGRGLLKLGWKNTELQAELFVQLVSPLFDQATRCHDQNAMRIGAHDELTDVEACHDRLASARIVSQDKSERLPGKHRFVDGSDLVRQRIDVRSVNRHHRIKEECQVDAFSFAG